ncbi:MAG: T9SS type A sorting domain-containing protein, partial [Candidatus Neomarinimicrobiota bacterium]
FLGWETPVMAGTMENINLKQIESGADTTIWKIPINAQEYFLVENRCAHVRPGVSLDSIQYRIYEENGENEWPSVFPLIKDTLKAEFSAETGVMLSVPHYDYGLPGSGLLIWHIDESIINPNLAANRVNLDRDHRGVDLEEGDGAQDLGYDAGILASDVNIGWYFDPWFAGNDGFMALNPNYTLDAEKRVGFTPYTNPASYSNGYAFTGISIDSIGAAGETMTFRIRQSDALENFPIDLATEPEEILPIDLNPGDQLEEILVITDSLRVYNTTGRQILSAPRNTVNVFDKDSLLIFGIDPGLLLSARRLASDGLVSDVDTLGLNGQTLIGSQLPISEGLLFTTQNSSGQNYLNYYQPVLHRVAVLAVDQAIQKIIGGSNNTFGATDDGQIIRIRLSPLSVETVADLPGAAGGTLVAAFINQNETPDLIHCTDSLLTLIQDIGTSPEATLSREQELNGNLAFADIDGDGKIEIIVASDDQIFAFNEDLTVENNFPIAVPFILGSDQFGAGLLTGDLDGDGHKDIIVNTSTALLAFNYRGDLLDGFPKIANPQSIKSGILLNTTNGAAYLALTQTDLSVLSYNRLAAVRLSSNFHTADDWICYGGNASRQFYYNVLSHSNITPLASMLNQAKTFCWPNPAKDNRTNIRYFPNHTCNITIDIYDLGGDLVANFKDSAPLVGEPNEKEWNTAGVESGVYFAVVKAKSGSRSDSKIIKILVVK